MRTSTRRMEQRRLDRGAYRRFSKYMSSASITLASSSLDADRANKEPSELRGEMKKIIKIFKPTAKLKRLYYVTSLK